MRLALLDYGAGNLTSVRKALRHVGLEVFTPGTPEELRDADGAIVPGVGHFDATRALDERWREALLAGVAAGRPLLGICLGMHWLFEGSTEEPGAAGLGLLPGSCDLLPSSPASEDATRVKVPHVGWNALDVVRVSHLLDGLPAGAHAYFTHSYAAPPTRDAVATTTHGRTFASVVERGRVMGVQFHPEKSGETGLAILRNFGRLVAGA